MIIKRKSYSSNDKSEYDIVDLADDTLTLIENNDYIGNSYKYKTKTIKPLRKLINSIKYKLKKDKNDNLKKRVQ